MQVRVCPNPECGAIFPPRDTLPETYCTDCGKVLELGGKNMLLVESKDPVPDNIVRMAAKGLSHGSVRAPLSAFVERFREIPDIVSFCRRPIRWNRASLARWTRARR